MNRIFLGMLTPSSNTILEPVTQAMVSGLAEVSVHFSRFKVTEIALSPSALATIRRWRNPPRCGIADSRQVARHSIDPGFAPGTGTPEPGGLLPREALEIVRLIAREGLCGMEVVEVSPPYDVNDNTAQLACRVMLDVLGNMVAEGKLGTRAKKRR
jgi:Arginase family